MLEFFIALPIGAIIGWIIREIISDRLARDRALESIKITEFNKASAIFRTVFVDAIFLLRQNIQTGEQMVNYIITPEVLIIHEKAKILFEPFLTNLSLDGFNSAWEKYKDYENNYYMEFLNPSQPIFKRPEPNPAKQESKKDFSQYCLTHIV